MFLLGMFPLGMLLRFWMLRGLRSRPCWLRMLLRCGPCRLRVLLRRRPRWFGVLWRRRPCWLSVLLWRRPYRRRSWSRRFNMLLRGRSRRFNMLLGYRPCRFSMLLRYRTCRLHMLLWHGPRRFHPLLRLRRRVRLRSRRRPGSCRAVFRLPHRRPARCRAGLSHRMPNLLGRCSGTGRLRTASLLRQRLSGPLLRLDRRRRCSTLRRRLLCLGPEHHRRGLNMIGNHRVAHCHHRWLAVVDGGEIVPVRARLLN